MPVSAEINYYFYCSNPTDTIAVVLLHGAGGTHLSWPVEIRRLPGYRVYALDLPGHGQSQMRGGQQTIGEYTSRVLEWLKAVKLPRAVFVGHSMGCAVALTLAIHHPEHVLAVGLIGGGVRLRVNPDLLVDAASSSTYLKAIEMIVRASFSSTASPRLVKLVMQRVSETRQSVFYGDLLACNVFDVSDHVNKVHQPALVICGIEDQMTPLRYSLFMANSLAISKMVVIPSAGHMVMLEKPQSVAGELGAWLKTVPYHPGEAH